MNQPDQTSTLLLFATRYLESLSPESAVAWALGELESGVETPSLLILASLSPPYDSWEVDSYLDKALVELRINVPPRTVTLLWYARHLAEGILANPHEPLGAMEQRMHRIAGICSALDYPAELLSIYELEDETPSNSTYWFSRESEWREAVLAEATTLCSALESSPLTWPYSEKPSLGGR